MHKTSCSTAEVGNEKNRTNPHLNSGKSISTNNPKQAANEACGQGKCTA